MTELDRKKLKLHKKAPIKTASSDTKPWRILVVDDDAQVHSMTDLLFKDFVFEGSSFEAVHAYSAAEAAERLANDPEIPVALVDVVMEQPDAGLNLVKIIRGKLENPAIRIILRTGQPGEAPEREVIQEYDINDYKAKTELTSQKLFTALVGALRSWRDIMYAAKMAELLAEANDTLERKVEERTHDLSKALEKVNEAKRDLRQFLSMMSHEFRTPLAVIDSAAQMLMLRQDDERREATIPRLETIRNGVDRLVGLIDTCLADDRLESETVELKTELSDLTPLLQAAIDQQRRDHPDRVIDLSLHSLPEIHLDMGLLVMSINNLLNNALKYSTKDIHVSASVQDSQIQVEITDHGIGIPPDDLDHIFDRFYRADNVKGMAGTGIGLHMSHRIVTLHGGSIDVISSEGVGSTFTIRLPVASV